MNRTESLHRSACRGNRRRPDGIGRRVLLPLLAVLLWGPARAQSIIHVDTDAAGANDGTSWADAFVYLQDALAVAQAGDEIWVAEGVYRPDQGAGITPGDREASFDIPGGVSLYGGFAGDETGRDDRDTDLYHSILNGDLMGNDAGPVRHDNPLRHDNSYRVATIVLSSATGGIVLDGLTFSGGMAYTGASGAGLDIHLNDPQEGDVPITVNDCVFTDNYSSGGTLYIIASPSTTSTILVVSNSTLSGNAGGSAGIVVFRATTYLSNVKMVENTAVTSTALDIYEATLYLDHSTIAYNEATRFGVVRLTGNVQGALLVISSSALVGNESIEAGPGCIEVDEATLVSINSVFAGNRSPNYAAGAMDIYASDAWIINNVIAHNEGALYAAGIGTHYSNTHVSNTIFWNNDSPLAEDLYAGNPDPGDPWAVTISHSLINSVLPVGVTDGGGLIAGHAQFVDADGPDDIAGTVDDDFRLSPGSPAVDAGSNDALYPDILDVDHDDNVNEPWPSDYEGNVRAFDGGSGVARVDMGPFELNAPPVGTFVFRMPETVTLPAPKMEVYPNPTAGSMEIAWLADRVDHARLGIIDLVGRRVQTLYAGALGTDTRFRADVSELTPGIYLLIEERTGGTSPFVVTR